MTLQSEAINELMGALAKAQGEMSHASKDSSNPHFKSKYADLASVWQACREPLSKNGLAVTQTTDFAGERQILVTMLAHSSGQWIKSILALPIQKPGAQELGSCLSYCRRYALAALVGVYQADDDGETAQQPYRESPQPVQSSPVQDTSSDVITEKQCNLLDFKLKSYPDVKQIILDTYKLKSIYDLTKAQFQLVMKGFEKRDLENKEKP